MQAARFTLSGDAPNERFAPFLESTSRQIGAGRRIVALYPTWRSEQGVDHASDSGHQLLYVVNRSWNSDDIPTDIYSAQLELYCGAREGQ